MANQVSFPSFRRRQGLDREAAETPAEDPRDRRDVFRRPFGPPPAPREEAPPAQPDLPLTRDQSRSRRKRDVRGRTISVKRLTKRELEVGRALYPTPEDAPPRPRTRGGCADVARPCPYVSCAHHLYLDVSARTGAIKLNFPDLEPDELPVSCVLDVADGGGVSLERAGELMNLTRERVRNLQEIALGKLATRDELVDEHGGLARSIVRLRVYPRPELVAVPESRPFDVERFVGEDLDGD